MPNYPTISGVVPKGANSGTDYSSFARAEQSVSSVEVAMGRFGRGGRDRKQKGRRCCAALKKDRIPGDVICERPAVCPPRNMALTGWS